MTGQKYIQRVSSMSPMTGRKRLFFCQPQGRGGKQSDKEKLEDKLLEEVTKSRTWPSHNHQTEQDVLSDFSLVSRVVSCTWDWGRLDTGWRAALLPEGHAVRMGEQPALVIRSYRRGALCWPGHLISIPGVPDILSWTRNPPCAGSTSSTPMSPHWS